MKNNQNLLTMIEKNENNSGFSIFGTNQYEITSKYNDETYHIFVYQPSEAPPSEKGFPVIYLLDGNAIFSSVVEAVRIQSRRPEKTGVIPAIVVAIGYPIIEPFSLTRFKDYTIGKKAESEGVRRPDGSPWPEQGGAEQFLAFIEHELIPQMNERFHIDANRQTIFGHSLGGLLVLHTLFTKPHLFQSYIAGSPSIHWNESMILKEEQQFIENLKKDHKQLKLFIGLGELEKYHKNQIKDKAQNMSKRLSIYEIFGLHVEFTEFTQEGHVSVLLPLINKALRFSLHP